MKKIEENRYPHSATLFKFCKEALAIRYEGNVKVIDQDVGAILGYDPADCSHWKKGKKNIRALATFRSIADHLSIDERLLIDIAAGRVGLDEAVYEFCGYGAFALEGQSLDNLKKEFFRQPEKWSNGNISSNFDEVFRIDREAIGRLVDSILTAGNFAEAPIYAPEVFQLYPNLQLLCEEDLEVSVKVDEGVNTIVRYRGPEMRPYMRFLIMKELFKFLVRSNNPLAAPFAQSPAELLDVQSNVFAGMLLVPGKQLRREVESVDSSLDLVAQLADVFWVSKGLMNQRLRDYMEYYQ